MRFLTIPQVAESLQCSENCVRDMIATGKIHAVRLGKTDHGDYRIAEAALLEFGVGGPRSVVLAVTSVTDSVTETGAPGRVRVGSGARFERRGPHA